MLINLNSFFIFNNPFIQYYNFRFKITLFEITIITNN